MFFVFNMDEIGVSRRGLPKFSEILRRPREAEVSRRKFVNSLHNVCSFFILLSSRWLLFLEWVTYSFGVLFPSVC